MFTVATAPPTASASASASPARQNANRQNAALSTGPRTGAGKDKSRQNSLKHGIYSESAVLGTEDPTQFQALIQALHRELQPRTGQQVSLIQVLVETRWRLTRILSLESSMAVVSADEQLPRIQEQYADVDDPEVHNAFARATAYRAECRLFEQMHRQENRLLRLYDRTYSELRKSYGGELPSGELSPVASAIPHFSSAASPAVVVAVSTPATVIPTPEPTVTLAVQPEPESQQAPEPVGFVPSEIVPAPAAPALSHPKMPKFSGPQAKQHRKNWLRAQARKNAA